MITSRRNFIRLSTVAGISSLLMADELLALPSPGFTPQPTMPPLIEAPDDPVQWPAFRRQLEAWRTTERKQKQYTGASYEMPSMEWTQQNFCCYFLMMYDLDFFDASKMEYTVDKVIRRGKQQFGGYDSVVLWHAYPRIGLDDRNQFDYFRDMHGGLAGIRRVVRQFHDNNIKVFIPYYPWDKASRRETKSDAEVLSGILQEIDGDGIFLDTMRAAGDAFNGRLEEFHQHGVCLESELALDTDGIAQHHASWAQWFNDKFTPGILRNKFFEPRHMQHQIARWNDDHSTELQMAWLNGSGMMVWENVFGQWMPWSKENKTTLMKMLNVQRRYWKLFMRGSWTPLLPTRQHGVFASEWEKDGIRLWTLINRNQQSVSGELMEVELKKNEVCYDVMDGHLHQPKAGKMQILTGMIPARSVQCFVCATAQKLGPDFQKFLEDIKSTVSAIEDEQLLSAKLAAPKQSAGAARDNKRTAEIQPATILLTSIVTSRECGSYESRLPIQIDLNRPIRYDRTANIPHLFADVTPVTNEEFYAFVKATSYQPKDATNFLKHWTDGKYPDAKADHPVVWVDINDARAYCQWAGKRLPTELEWQFIAGGYERFDYPWGKELNNDRCNSRSSDTTGVHTYPQGASPLGCLDMCGNTWELTESEYSDEHNRFCMLKGGSHYKAEGSIWYTPGGALPSTHSVKMLLMYPGLDRSPTIGFRGVREVS